MAFANLTETQLGQLIYNAVERALEEHSWSTPAPPAPPIPLVPPDLPDLPAPTPLLALADPQLPPQSPPLPTPNRRVQPTHSKAYDKGTRIQIRLNAQANIQGKEERKMDSFARAHSHRIRDQGSLVQEIVALEFNLQSQTTFLGSFLVKNEELHSSDANGQVNSCGNDVSA